MFCQPVQCRFEQWRIQDFFSDGGAPTPKRYGLFGQIITENCMKVKEIGPTGASQAPSKIRQWFRGRVTRRIKLVDLPDDIFKTEVVMSFKVCRLKNAIKVGSAPSINSSGVADSGFPKGRQPQRGAFNLESEPVVDLRGAPAPPTARNVLNFMHFFWKFAKIVCWHPSEGSVPRPTCEPWKAYWGCSPVPSLLKPNRRLCSVWHPSFHPLSLLWGQICFVTARNEVGARLYFHRRLWFCSQGRGGLPQCMLGYSPPTRQPPWTRHPPTRHPPRPGTRAPSRRRACWEIWSTRGRYASYWNAIWFSGADPGFLTGRMSIPCGVVNSLFHDFVKKKNLKLETICSLNPQMTFMGIRRKITNMVPNNPLCIPRSAAN